MPPPLPSPDGTAVVTVELQRGVVGDVATTPELATSVRESGVLQSCARLLSTARHVGVPVVHACVEWEADRRGTPLNTPLLAALAKNPAQMLRGTAAVELVPELGDTSADLRSTRRHGLTPFTGTDLDPLLRSLGTETVVAIGVSLNVGVLGLCLSAVDLGYRVVVPSDAVAAVPLEYGHDVLRHTLAPLATLTMVDQLIDTWQQGPATAAG